MLTLHPMQMIQRLQLSSFCFEAFEKNLWISTDDELDELDETVNYDMIYRFLWLLLLLLVVCLRERGGEKRKIQYFVEK